ncbi:glycosyltransferase family 4 protein [Subtercola lobariae]|uniref:Glycosyl transferase family 1 domain-containing protein n=1 Tax=Subtercola lobariae TaxID=1588641 RepID=A0A917B1W5_9MICO|nr:glycosyltransferase family 1 protein [Subtercola lobariae]GGF14100.1 hypothetical protein GCM10011399_04950 [Subtercola lobariae]
MIASDDRLQSLEELIGYLGGSVRGSTSDDHFEQLGELLDERTDYARLWLVWCTLRGELAVEGDILAFRRDVKLNGGRFALDGLGQRVDHSIFGYGTTVDIVTGAILVDVHDTCRTDKISGIQRVVRETVSRWAQQNDLQLVAWTHDRQGLRHLSATEKSRVLDKTAATSAADDPIERERLIVPNGGLLIVPELALESERAARLLCMGRFAETRTAFIGHDLVPITSGETSIDSVASHFPLYLDAVGYAAGVAGNSASTSAEFDAFKLMLAASGRSGPVVKPVFLAADIVEPSAADLAAARKRLNLGDEPLVLVVGTHEPRKNHLAVLQAARSLWRSGLSFRLAFLGSSAWGSDAFDQFAAVLHEQGYPIVVLRTVTDSLLAASYRLASVSVFVSFHEGFGLPVVESLRSGTPVIASNFGSMKEIADRYAGVLTVDPRSDRQIAKTLSRVLSEPAILTEMQQLLSKNHYRSWDDYANETWQFFTALTEDPSVLPVAADENGTQNA